MSADYLKRLRTDERAEDARTRMQKRGVDADRWAWIIEQVSHAAHLYAVLAKETRPQMEKRRRRLAAKFEALAKAVDHDPETQHLYIYDHKSVTNTLTTDRPTVSEFLNDLATFVTNKTNVNAGHLFDRRLSLKAYALQVAYDLLSNAQEIRYSAPNRAVELLVSALIDEDIPAGTTTQIRKSERRKYGPEQ